MLRIQQFLLHTIYRIKYHATKKKDDMFDRIDRDVEQAIADYNESLTEEDKCQVFNNFSNLIIS